MKQMTEQEALFKLSAMCSSAEHCSYEMVKKMTDWGLPEDTQARIMAYLTKEKYVDDTRYCGYFAKDKLKYNGWGRRKIEQALYMKRIPKDIYEDILNGISDEDYVEVLRPLMKGKRKSTKAKNEYELNMKLIRFALGRGFGMDIIKRCVDDTEEYGIDGEE
jgi:regulatory protein